VKAEHRFSKGMWALFSYTMQKQFSEAETPGGNGGFQISPYQPERRQSLGLWDVPQSLNISYIYQLPFGTGKSWLNQGRFVDAVVGGWVTTGVYRFQGGTPFEITSSNCNVPSQIQATCLPGLLPGANPYLQSSSHIDVNKPFLNVAAFEPVNAFNFYTGYGRITQPFRQPGFNSFDVGLKKVFHIKERATFELRGDAFNVVNGHHFSEVHVANGWSAFTTDISSPAFGMWAGAVTPPRNIQVSGRISF
jgi:hypothetical protein